MLQLPLILHAALRKAKGTFLRGDRLNTYTPTVNRAVHTELSTWIRHNWKQKDDQYSTSDHVQLAHNSHKLLSNLLVAISLFLFYLDPIQIIEDSGFSRSQAIQAQKGIQSDDDEKLMPKAQGSKKCREVMALSHSVTLFPR